MPWNAFLIPLLAGYTFIHLFHLTKFRAQKHDGYRLLIESTLVGVALFVAARLAAAMAQNTQYGVTALHWAKHEGLIYPFIGSGAGALVLAIVLPLIGNLIVGAERAKNIVVKKHSNGFLRLFHDAATKTKLVSVTLESNKVYIGFIMRTPNLTPDEQFVDLLPLLSGYRDKDTMRLTITTNYAKVISSTGFRTSDFVITFGLGGISTANIFDPDAYPLFGDVPPPETDPLEEPLTLALSSTPPQPESNAAKQI